MDELTDPPLTDTEIAGLLALRYAPDEVPSEDRRAVAEAILETIAPCSNHASLCLFAPRRYSEPPLAPMRALMTLGDRSIQVTLGPKTGLVFEPIAQVVQHRARLGFAFFRPDDCVIEKEEGYSRVVHTDTMANGHEVLGPLLYLWKEAAHELDGEREVAACRPIGNRHGEPGDIPGLRREAA